MHKLDASVFHCICIPPICKADKGDSTVVMSTKHYLELAYKHLSDENTHQLLEFIPEELHTTNSHT